MIKMVLFQSTHPLRGATGFQNVPRGVHQFQSTHPSRGATRRIGDKQRGISISIHAPLAGCDMRWLFTEAPPRFISIHAPLAGCDRVLPEFREKKHDFNPRTPCGVRRVNRPPCYPRQNFNPRTPCGARRGKFAKNRRNFAISIHAPLAGRDVPPVTAFKALCVFQSTHPLRGATS